MSSLAAAPWSVLLAPAFLVLGLVCLLPGVLPMTRSWARLIVAGAVAAAVLRYLHWRATETLIIDQAAPLATAWSLFCFAVELIAMWDAGLLFLAFVRVSHRSPEADAFEPRLRALTPDAAPSVDILIPTYNEPLSVLEKTIVGAQSLEWPNRKIFVLDDGRRAWLRDFCLERGVGYVTRPDNKGAKAGNINHALRLTSGEFVAIFDADFVPQRNFLMRTMGFFEDPQVGIVQTPHAFYNHDPMQTNLAMRKSLPDDQRFFFEAIMPSRDGWNAAFCCGSNSVTRRAALDSVGGALPDGSITEDMLLSLVLLRQGYVTRYLSERLAYGLAPESVSAFFVQRQRWARGAIQLLFLRSGPLGAGLRLIHRLLFMPTHWLTHSLMTLTSLAVPLVFLLFNLPPTANTGIEAAAHYLLPTLIAIFGGLMVFGAGRYHPLAAQVLGTFQSFKLLPTVVTTLIRPHGHAFKVTPKGSDAGVEYERGIFFVCAGLIVLTLLGLVLNVIPETRRVEDMALVPIVATWCGINILILFLVSLLCLQVPVRRQEERFAIEEPVMLRHPQSGALETLPSIDMSLSGVGLARHGGPGPWAADEAVQVYLSGVGWVSARVARATEDLVGVEFHHEGTVERDLLIRKLFTSGRNTATETDSALKVTLGLVTRIFTADMRVQATSSERMAPHAAQTETLPAASFLALPTDREAAFAEAVDRLERAA